MNPFLIFNNAVKKAFKVLGFDLVRKKNSPELTLLGLGRFPFRTIIDVGANTGQFAKRILGILPEAKIYCFEPLPDTYNILSRWSEKQKGRVVSVNLAIGEKERDVEMFLHEDHTPSSSLLCTTNMNQKLYPFTKRKRKIWVKQMPLDSVLEQSATEFLPPLLIKVDVQGYEDRVIAGGHKTFSAASACILEVVLDHLYEGQADFLVILLMLKEMGYRYAGNLSQAYGNDGHCIFLDAVFVKRETKFSEYQISN